MTPADLPRAPLACGDLSALLRAGNPAAFPTDTLPALAMAPAWAAELWQIKQRAANKPLILMAAGRDELLAALGMPPPQGWEQLANQGWPGGLTLVLPAKGAVVEALNPGGSSLGLRIPACPMALQLLRCTGPLATTSVNGRATFLATSIGCIAQFPLQCRFLALSIARFSRL